MSDVIDEIWETVKKLLEDYQPLPLDAQADREQERLECKVRELEDESNPSGRPR